MSILTRIFRPSATKAAEGQYRDGPWLTMDGWIPASWGKSWNWWQSGHNPLPIGERSAILEACISSYAQTIAMCPGDHWREATNGGRERVRNSALSRILRNPNSYQSSSDFLLNLVRSVYGEGNAYAVALRNNRFEPSELHLMDPRRCSAWVAGTGDVFYSLGGNEIIERRLMDGQPSSARPLAAVPARDVLHVRLATPQHPLRGESPFAAAVMDGALGAAMAQQAILFYANQSRPSGIIQTDERLTREQSKELSERWEEYSKGLNVGKVPILSSGLKWQSMSFSANDTQFAETMKLTEQHIALAYRVPLAVLGIGGTAFSSTEALMQSWISTGLGFAINHVEQAYDRLFGLPGVPDEYTEFNTEALLRSAFKDRIEGWVAGVQGGLFAPNEARLAEGFKGVEFGDEPRVQQQMVPLSFWGQNPPQAPAKPAAPEPANNNNGADASDDVGTADEPDARELATAILRASGDHVRSLH